MTLEFECPFCHERALVEAPTTVDVHAEHACPVARKAIAMREREQPRPEVW